LEKGFEEFVREHLVPRKTWICQNQSEWLKDLRLDRTLKVERLKEDFLSLPFVHPGEEIPLSNKGEYRQDYPVTMEIILGIQEWAAEDFDQFDYPRLKV
jgi:hypothetical protein